MARDRNSRCGSPRRSDARRTLGRFVSASAIAFGIGLANVGASIAAAPATADYPGTFALPGKVAKVAATLHATFSGPTSAHLDISETTTSGQTITDYDIDMTKRLHLIVVSDDLESFQHVHPALGADGHFSIDLTVPKPGHYLIYADAVPHGRGQQVFRFEVPFGDAPAAKPHLRTTPASVRAGPYRVTLSTLNLDAGETTMIEIHVTKNERPATDLSPYLGGAGHAVFISAGDDSYIHVHPMPGTDMSSMSGMGGMGEMGEMKALPDAAKVEPAMMLHVAAPRAGAYKLWFQFRGGGRLYVAPFVLTAG
jgi:hypothetical protein